MRLLVVRPSICTPGYTRSPLFIDGKYECEVMEDEDRRVEEDASRKIAGITCIPRGIYNIIVNISNRFKRLLPLVVDVPGFEGVRIHPGNTAANTEGCLLPGLKDDNRPDRVLMSRVTFEGIMVRIQAALARGEKVELEIR